MKKKAYEKPTVIVVELHHHRTSLLQTSGVPDYDDWLGNAPGIGKDGNHSA